MACMLWATAFVGIKIGLQYATPLQFAGIRFFIAGIMILPFIKDFKRKWVASLPYWKTIVAIAILQTTILYALFYLGLARVPAAIGAMLAGASPLFIALVAHFTIRTDRMTFHKMICILLGMLGVAIISLTKGGVSSGDYPFIWLGIVFLIINNIAAGAGNVLVAIKGKNLPPLMLSSFALSIGGALLFIISLFVEGTTFHVVYPPSYYIALGWLSFLSATAISIWYTLLQRPSVKVSDLSMWKFMIPVLGACFSWIVFADESPNAISLIGMTIIGGSLLLLNMKRKMGNPFRKQPKKMA